MNFTNPLPAVYLKIIGALAIVLVAIGLFAAGYAKGEGAGTNKVQVAWDKAQAVAATARAQRIAAAAAVQLELQRKKDEDHAKELAARDARNSVLLADLDGLRKRPQRPQPRPSGVPPAPGAGPPAACTGAGLYGDDAEFLARLAASAQDVRQQRDEYWRRYEEARAALARIQGPSAGQ